MLIGGWPKSSPFGGAGERSEPERVGSPFGGAGERSEPERVGVPLGELAANAVSRLRG